MNKRKRQLLASNKYKVRAMKDILVWGRRTTPALWSLFEPAFKHHVAEITALWTAAANSFSAKLKEIKGVGKEATDV